MKRVIIASTNPVKIEATRLGFEKMFPDETFTFEGHAVNSGVSDQPIGREETLSGARNRVKAVVGKVPQADYWVGLEGGIQKFDDSMEATAWIVVRDASGNVGHGQTGSFVLPNEITNHINQGKELGVATDIVFSKTNTKQAGGTIAELTNGRINRTIHYETGVIFALVSFKNPELYPS